MRYVKSTHQHVRVAISATAPGAAGGGVHQQQRRGHQAQAWQQQVPAAQAVHQQQRQQRGEQVPCHDRGRAGPGRGRR